jgi:hypothetical protein
MKTNTSTTVRLPRQAGHVFAAGRFGIDPEALRLVVAESPG